MNRPHYKKRYEVFANIAVVTSIISITAIYAAYSFYRTARGLKDTQNVMIWTMDSSCYQQLQGSGTLRLIYDTNK